MRNTYGTLTLATRPAALTLLITYHLFTCYLLLTMVWWRDATEPAASALASGASLHNLSKLAHKIKLLRAEFDEFCCPFLEQVGLIFERS